MAIGLVTDDEFEKELKRISGKRDAPSTHAPVIVEKPSKGRSEGDVNVPDSLRQIIGEEAVINGRKAALKIATEFGISSSSVSAYAKGATSTTTYDKPKQSILSHITKSRTRAIKRASTTLNAALGSITQDKLDYADAKELAGIAKDMSVVIKNLEPPTPTTDQSNTINAPQFVIFAPSFRKEDTFETITVNE